MATPPLFPSRGLAVLRVLEGCLVAPAAASSVGRGPRLGLPSPDSQLDFFHNFFVGVIEIVPCSFTFQKGLSLQPLCQKVAAALRIPLPSFPLLTLACPTTRMPDWPTTGRAKRGSVWFGGQVQDLNVNQSADEPLLQTWQSMFAITQT